jgi:uncharacterized protein
MGDDPGAVRTLDNLAGVDPDQWNALAGGHPFLRHELFHALHETGCASERSGWLPRFVTLWEDGALIAAMPLYLKFHSYGEYVFDWAWADAYQRHGLEYYPKLVSAVPFSPVQGSRLLASNDAARIRLLRAALALAEQTSSLHILFPPESEAKLMADSGMLLRHGLQFHWCNPGYASFEAFLGALAHDKRKKIRQERRKLRDAGVRFRWLLGRDIRSEDWLLFTRCYKSTYRAHHSTPYLNRAFFERLGEVLPENVMLVVAELDGNPVASALNLFSEKVLYGRYWGAVAYVPGLHFETCYYQTIEFCIERGIEVFEGGAQGEHKLSRGFLPVQTVSAHWLKHTEFARAVERFLERETAGVERYLDELNERAPFRKA